MPTSVTVRAENRSAGTYSVCSGWRPTRSPGYRARACFGDLAGAFDEVPGTGRRERAAHAGGGDETAVRRTVPSICPDGLSVTTNTSPSFVRPAGVRSTAT